MEEAGPQHNQDNPDTSSYSPFQTQPPHPKAEKPWAIDSCNFTFRISDSLSMSTHTFSWMHLPSCKATNTNQQGDLSLPKGIIWFLHHLTQKTHFPQTLKFTLISGLFSLPSPSSSYRAFNVNLLFKRSRATMPSEACILHQVWWGIMRNSLLTDAFRSSRRETAIRARARNLSNCERLKQEQESP